MIDKHLREFIRFLKINGIYNEFLTNTTNSHYKTRETTQEYLRFVSAERVITNAFEWFHKKWNYYNAAWQHIWCGISLEKSINYAFRPYNDNELKDLQEIIDFNKKYFDEYVKSTYEQRGKAEIY